MIWARPISQDRRDDVELALVRMGLPTPAREYVLEKQSHLHVLFTGLSPEQVKLLFASAEAVRTSPLVRGEKALRPGTVLVSGTRAEHERLVSALQETPLQAPLRGALEAETPPAPLQLGSGQLVFGASVHLMGILNVTPDSFSDGGQLSSVEQAVARGLAMADEGAALLDVGGESTRPGATPVGEAEETDRVVPVIEALRARTHVPLSVDTRHAAVAQAALDAGAVLVNDVSGFAHDPEMAKVVARAGAACCLMHMQGTPGTMQQAPHYDDVMDEVLTGLAASIACARQAGIAREKILVDPGLGFGKTPLGHNLVLMRRAAELRVLGQPLLLGISRKASLGMLTGGKPVGERVHASVGAAAFLASTGGADILRVHDVGATRDALRVVEAVRKAQAGGDLYASRPTSRKSSE